MSYTHDQRKSKKSVPSSGVKKLPDPASNPIEITEAGEKIYREKYQERAEEQHVGKFLAINVRTEEAFLEHGREEALQEPGTPTRRDHFI